MTIVGDFNTPHNPMGRSCKQNWQGNTTFKWHIGLDKLDIYKAFHPKAAECTSFSNTQGPFFWTDSMLGHKASHGKFKKTEIISSIFSDHNAMRLDINYKKKNYKKHNHLEIKQHISK